MKYYKYENPYIEDEVATDFLEVDNEVVLRQLSVFKHKFYSSNVDLALTDQPFEYEKNIDEGDDTIIPIEAKEFEKVWQKHLEEHEVHWQAAKARLPICSNVIGCIAIFFPQGIIVRLGQHALSVTDYRQAKTTADSKFIMRTGRIISGVVMGYDEINQWIKLGSPNIHTDKECDPHDSK